jgi:hypothetical protein
MQEKPVVGTINHGLRDTQLLAEQLDFPCLGIHTLGNFFFQVAEEYLQQQLPVGLCARGSDDDTFGQLFVDRLLCQQEIMHDFRATHPSRLCLRVEPTGKIRRQAQCHSNGRFTKRVVKRCACHMPPPLIQRFV